MSDYFVINFSCRNLCFSHIFLFRIISWNYHGQRNQTYPQIWSVELALSISKHYFCHTAMFWYFYKNPTQQCFWCLYRWNDESSDQLDTYKQTQPNSASYASAGANDVSPAGLDQIMNHHCNEDNNIMKIRSHMRDFRNKFLILLFWWYNIHHNHTKMVHTAFK